MIVKNKETDSSSINIFDLLGSNEVALSKAFAFVLSNSKEATNIFLKFIGVAEMKSNTFNSLEVQIERVRDQGRTDIEIIFPDCHVIIECKVGSNKILKQRNQYNEAFLKTKQKFLCFITQERDGAVIVNNGINVIHVSWFDIIELFNSKSLRSIDIIKQFLNFCMRNYQMKNLKEILIQDMSAPNELKRFSEHNVYRRNETFGTPLYFAPYFTRKAGGMREGISYLSKILGVLTIKANCKKENFKNDLSKLTKDAGWVNQWLDGIEENSNDTFTYYFLDKGLELTHPLKKDSGIEKGRGKDWIAAAIPPNRCVSFETFTSKVIDSLTLRTL